MDKRGPEPPEGTELCPRCAGHGDVPIGGGPSDAWGADVTTCDFCAGAGWITLLEETTMIDFSDRNIYDIATALRGPDIKLFSPLNSSAKELFTARLRFLVGCNPFHSGFVRSLPRIPRCCQGFCRELRSLDVSDGLLVRGMTHYLHHLESGFNALREIELEATPEVYEEIRLLLLLLSATLYFLGNGSMIKVEQTYKKLVEHVGEED